MFPDRRQYPRLVPDSPLLVHADEYTGLLSDLCEGGLAVHSRFPNIHGQLFFLTVELPGSNSTMRVTAQTTWTSDSENKTGLRFVHLPAAARQQLREWVSARSTTTVKEVPPACITSQSDAQFNLAEVRRQLSAVVEAAELGAPRRNDALLRLTGLVLAAATLCSVFIFLGYYLGSGRRHPQTRTLAPVAETVGLHARGQEEPEKLPPSTNQPPITVPLDTPGFVLQVGAMTHESNANALSDSLQRNNFPAFVFKRSSDRFYKVAVGAFANADSAAVVKRELEKQGFKAILRQWSPE